MADLFSTWASSQIENTPFDAPVAITAGLGVALFLLCKCHIWILAKAAMLMNILGLCIFTWNFCLWKMPALYWATGICLFLPWFICLLVFLINRHRLKEVQAYADQDSLNYQLIAALKKLKQMRTDYLTTSQKHRYDRYEVMLLVSLGSIKAAEEKLGDLQEDAAFYTFVRHVIAHIAGNMAKAKEYVKQAEDRITQDTDKLIVTEILVNQGVSYVTLGNYPVAEEYFRKAVASYRDNNLSSPAVRSLIYSNWTFNQSRIFQGNDAKESVEQLLQEYESQIDLTRHSELLNRFNLRLEMLRQFHASREETDKLVHDAFRTVMALDIPLANKCMFAGSMTRIICHECLNPEPCLDFWQQNMDAYDLLRPECRYFAFKELNMMFKSLHGPLVERFVRVKDRAQQYMQYAAAKDLDAWQLSLPSEAILARCQCLTEKAGLQRINQCYDREQAAAYLRSAADLYRENALFLDECMSRLNYVDDLCGQENVDEDLHPVMRDEMLSQLAEIETFLPQLEDHPVLNEIHIRCGFYYTILDDYDRCIACYQTYSKNQVTLDHFAPWVQRYAMVLELHVRALYFYRGILQAQAALDADPEGLSPEARQWFDSFPSHDGLIDSALLGRFMGYPQQVLLKTKLWLNDTTAADPQGHTWLWMDVLRLGIDITFAQFTQEPDPSLLFFADDTHPFESQKARTIQESIRQTNIVFQPMTQLLDLRQFSAEQQSVFDEIYRLILRFIPADCTPIERIMQLYQRLLLPVPALEPQNPPLSPDAND